MRNLNVQKFIENIYIYICKIYKIYYDSKMK